MPKLSTSSIIWIGGVLVAGASGAALYGIQTSSISSDYEAVADWQKYSDSARAINGSPRSKVKMVIFTDYQCPYCRELHVELDTLADLIKGDVEITIRHDPNTKRHPMAWEAALAVECATYLGRRREMHATLSRYQGHIGQLSWGWFAKESGINDSTVLVECVENEAAAEPLNADIQLARQLGVHGTPTYLINDRIFRGVGPAESLKAILERSLR